MTTIVLKLFVSQETDTERLTIHHEQVGTPDDKSTWLYGTLEKRYYDDRTVCADCWVTWDAWLLMGTDGVKASLLVEVRKTRRRQLRGTANDVARATTFVLR